MSENNTDLWSIVENDLIKRSGALSKNISFLEYYTDIISLILKDVVAILPPESITPQLQAKLNILSTILEQSSIDLNLIESPYEYWKVGGIIELKKLNNDLRQLYLAKMNGL